MWYLHREVLVLACVGLLSISGLCVEVVSAEDIPDPNPRRNPDGTFTWWVGNNMQFPVIQEVLDVALPGDEVVVMPGLYVEDLTIVTGDLSIRPACIIEDEIGVWGDTVFWNPTEGIEDDPWCMRVVGGDNTYVGRPRQYTQLANGYQTLALVDPGEWDPQLPAVGVQEVTVNSDGVAFRYWSRDDESVAINVVDGAPTFHACTISSQKGFGCGLLVHGAASSPEFVDCIFENLFSDDEMVDGVPISPITILEEEGASVLASFRNCIVRNCTAGSRGVVNQTGGRTSWSGSTFENLNAPVADGVYEAIGGPAVFFECSFVDCTSRLGTVWIDATNGLDPRNPVLFDRCDFLGNTTIDGQYGGVLRAIGEVGVQPPIELSGCGIDGNNGHVGFSFFDIDTPFFPFYRVGADLVNRSVLTSLAGDLNNDGKVDGEDLVLFLGNWTG